MRPVAKFYSGSNELTADELWLAAIFRKRIVKISPSVPLKVGRLKIFLSLRHDSFFSRYADTPTLLRRTSAGLPKDFDHEEWEAWKSKALK